MPFHGGAEDQSYAESNDSELKAFLVETTGPTVGKRFGLRPVSRIGRDVRFDIRPNDPEISRHHATLTFNGETFIIRDLGSMNGTYLNENRLVAELDTPLKPGDIVRVGRTSMRFVRE
jgi:pSer/pThr/pTyr-binding forkhead associated (FHA) protein